MNNFFQVDAFNCTFGCENAAQCEYNNGSNFIAANQYQLAQQQQQPFVNNNATQCVNNKNFDDGVVPSNLYENSNAYQHQQQQMHLIQPNNNNYGGGAQYNDFSAANFPISAAPSAISYNNNSDNNYFIEPLNVPCRGPPPYNYAECFGFYGDAPCQYANVAVDMEDFM